MKVLQVGKFFYPDKGGIETVTEQIQIGLSEKGILNDVLCSNSKNKTEIIDRDFSKIIKTKSFGVLFSTALSPVLLWRFITKVRRYDVIQVHAPNPLADICILLTPKKIPIVMYWHSDIVGFGFLFQIYKFFQIFSIKRSNVIIAATENHFKYSNMKKYFSRKSKVIPYWIKDLSGKSLAGQKIPFEEGYVLSIGRLVDYKGFIELIKCIHKTDFRLVILGTGPLQEKIENLIDSLGLKQRVFLVGEVSEDLKLEYIKKCSFVCLPSNSKKEMFGMVQLEAFRFSRPCLSSNIPGSGVQCVNLEGVSGWTFQAGDSKDLYEKLSYLEKLDSAEIKKMGNSAYEHFVKNYKSEVNIKKLENLYLEVFQNRENS